MLPSALPCTGREVRAQEDQDQEEGPSQPGPSGRQTGAGVDWAQHPEAAAAVVIYHELIMKIKRILLVYM